MSEQVTRHLGSQSSDEELVELASQGKTEAFEALVLRYQDRLFNLLARMNGSEDGVDDLVQDVFMSYLANAGGVRGDLTAYLMSAIRYASWRYCKEKGIEEPLSSVAERGTSSETEVTDQLSNREALRAALEQLNPRCQETLCFVYLNGGTIKSLADALDISPKSACAV